MQVSLEQYLMTLLLNVFVQQKKAPVACLVSWPFWRALKIYLKCCIRDWHLYAVDIFSLLPVPFFSLFHQQHTFIPILVSASFPCSAVWYFYSSLLDRGIWYNPLIHNVVFPFLSILFWVTLLVVYVRFLLQMILLLPAYFRELDLYLASCLFHLDFWNLHINMTTVQ